MTISGRRSLQGKVVIVTGGTQGLGEGIALHLAEMGAKGLVICGRNSERGKRVAAALDTIGTASVYVQADLQHEEDCRRVVRSCDTHFGCLNGLVNAAGITTRGTLEATTVGLWDQIFAVNVRAPFILAQESVRLMRRQKRGGGIVNIISTASHCGPPYLAAYSSSKGALATFTRNAAHSLRHDRIRVNGLNIGWTNTPAEDAVQKATGKPDNWLELAEANSPFGRLLLPRDVAGLTAYLLSDDSEMVTGALIDFDQNVLGGRD
jgi:NAD(P)-dependent dehydrogenase (short-subunit alcohol dehydrogenase family)